MVKERLTIGTRSLVRRCGVLRQRHHLVHALPLVLLLLPQSLNIARPWKTRLVRCGLVVSAIIRTRGWWSSAMSAVVKRPGEGSRIWIYLLSWHQMQQSSRYKVALTLFFGSVAIGATAPKHRENSKYLIRDSGEIKRKKRNFSRGAFRWCCWWWMIMIRHKAYTGWEEEGKIMMMMLSMIVMKPEESEIDIHHSTDKPQVGSWRSHENKATVWVWRKSTYLLLFFFKLKNWRTFFSMM